MSTKIMSYVVACIALLAIYATIRRFRINKLSTRVLIAWIALWSGMAFFAVFPVVLDYIRQLVSMRDRLAFLFVSAIVVLYLAVFYVSSQVAEINRKLTKISQHMAIMEYQFDQEQKEHGETQGLRENDNQRKSHE